MYIYTVPFPRARCEQCIVHPVPFPFEMPSRSHFYQARARRDGRLLSHCVNFYDPFPGEKLSVSRPWSSAGIFAELLGAGMLLLRRGGGGEMIGPAVSVESVLWLLSLGGAVREHVPCVANLGVMYHSLFDRCDTYRTRVCYNSPIGCIRQCGNPARRPWAFLWSMCAVDDGERWRRWNRRVRLRGA